jgi:hypothetical protein
MKNIVNVFVLALVLTGVAATTQISSASSRHTVTAAAKVSCLPIPSCAPDDPNACGMGLGR